MALTLYFNKIATRTVGYIDGLQGPRDYSLFADFSRDRIITRLGESDLEECFADIFKFSRDSKAEVTDQDGSRRIVEAHVPRFSYQNGIRGLLMEQARTNHVRASGAPKVHTFTVRPHSMQRVLVVSMEGSGSITVSGAISSSATDTVAPGITVTAVEGQPAAVYALNQSAPATVTITPTGIVSFAQAEVTVAPHTQTSRIHNESAIHPCDRQADILELLPSKIASLLGTEFTLVTSIEYPNPQILDSAIGIDTRHSIMVAASNGDHIAVARQQLPGSPAVRTRTRIFVSGKEISTPALGKNVTGASCTHVLGRSEKTLKFAQRGSVATDLNVPAAFEASRVLLASPGLWGAIASGSGLLTRVIAYRRLLSDEELACTSLSWT